MRLSKITVIAMAGLFSTVLVSTQVHADCNIKLPYEQLVDCIVTEGAESPYNTNKEQDTDYISENSIKQNLTISRPDNLAVVK